MKPDLMVFPPAYSLPAEVHRDRSDCALRPHDGDPPPELVVEILSGRRTTGSRRVCTRLWAWPSTGCLMWVAFAGRIHQWNCPCGSWRPLCTRPAFVDSSRCRGPVGGPGVWRRSAGPALSPAARSLRAAFPVVGCGIRAVGRTGVSRPGATGGAGGGTDGDGHCCAALPARAPAFQIP